MFKSICYITAMMFLLAGMTVSADANMKVIGRRAFLRNEKNAALKVIVQADKTDLPALEITGSAAGRPIKNIKIPPLSKGSKTEIRIPLETRLTVGKYPIELTLNGKGIAQQTVKDQLLISPRLTDRMPVLIWGMGTFHHQDLQEEGFTHAVSEYWRSSKFESHPHLDQMLFDGFRGLDSHANAKKLLKQKAISLRMYAQRKALSEKKSECRRSCDAGPGGKHVKREGCCHP